jgi:hypothetical protein
MFLITLIVCGSNTVLAWSVYEYIDLHNESVNIQLQAHQEALTRIEAHTAAHCDLTAVQAELARLVELVDFAQTPAQHDIVGYEPSDAD